MKRLLDNLNFKYPNKNRDEKFKLLETSKRNAEFLFTLIRNEYKNKYIVTPLRDREIYQEAIDALDSMYEKYLLLKKYTKRDSIDNLIEITGRWFTYVNCIEIMIDHITGNNNYQKNMDASAAKLLSKELWNDFEQQLKKKNAQRK